jgi:hypothetical protein
MIAPSPAQIDAGAEALRQYEQGGRILRKWEDLPNSDKRKWRDKATVVLRAAATEAAP